jgi:hypothetical protein
MAARTSTRQRKVDPDKRPVEAVRLKACDNHPDRLATFSTTSNGAHQEINFCDRCVPEHWR